MADSAQPGLGEFSAAALLAFLAAWAVMMAAMMLPSAAPMIGLYAALRPGRDRPRIPAAAFALIYLLAWIAFGLPVYVLGLGLAHPALMGFLPYGIAIALLGAGCYQFSPLKMRCLRQCRSPMGFLMGHWREGYGGTLLLALRHASYCLGCCWALMIVLVVAGGMGLNWVALIAALVFVEKILPLGPWTARAGGAVLVLLGFAVAFQPALAAALRGPTM